MKTPFIAVIAAGLLWSSLAQAQQPTFYSCKVGSSYKIENGELQRIQSGTMKMGQTNGQLFHVNIQTGVIIGDGFSSASWSRTVVLDDGKSPRGSDYKVLYSSPPGNEFINVAYLLVRYDGGPNKSFIFLDAGEVFSGICHYAS